MHIYAVFGSDFDANAQLCAKVLCLNPPQTHPKEFVATCGICVDHGPDRLLLPTVEKRLFTASETE